jgi:hypothetical protein
VVVLGEAAVTQAVAVVVSVVVSAGRRTSQAGLPASVAEASTSQADPRAWEAEVWRSQAELACHRSDRTSLRDPAG